jgi:hypothetical protein
MAQGAVAQGDGQGRCHKLRWLDQYLGGKDLDTITARSSTASPTRSCAGCSNATVNRTLECCARFCASASTMGVARSGAQDADAEGTDAADSLPDARGGARALPSYRSIWRHGGVLARDGLRAANVTGCSGRKWIGTTVGVDSSRPSEGAESAYRFRSTRRRWLISKQAGSIRRTCFSFRGKPIPGEHQSLVCGARAARIRIFAGTICGTPGRAGTCRTARRCLRCRS